MPSSRSTVQTTPTGVTPTRAFFDVLRHADGTAAVTAIATSPYTSIEIVLSDDQRQQLIRALGGTP
jgi:hypothetical protein